MIIIQDNGVEFSDLMCLRLLSRGSIWVKNSILLFETVCSSLGYLNSCGGSYNTSDVFENLDYDKYMILCGLIRKELLTHRVLHLEDLMDKMDRYIMCLRSNSIDGEKEKHSMNRQPIDRVFDIVLNEYNILNKNKNE